MEALTTSLVVAVAVFLSSLIGLSLHRVVPEGHLSQETRSVILLGTGTLSLLASLVLGLLISTAKSSYDATESRIQNYAAELILLDETLRDYGDSALAPRRCCGTTPSSLCKSCGRRPVQPEGLGRARLLVP